MPKNFCTVVIAGLFHPQHWSRLEKFSWIKCSIFFSCSIFNYAKVEGYLFGLYCLWMLRSSTSNKEAFPPLPHIIYKLDLVLLQCDRGVCLARNILLSVLWVVSRPFYSFWIFGRRVLTNVLQTGPLPIFIFSLMSLSSIICVITLANYLFFLL